MLGPDHQPEIVGDNGRVFNFKTRAGRRDVPHHALEAAGWHERNRAAFENTVSWSSTAFHDPSLGRANYKPVKFEAN